jgi:hypothetical protein
VSSAETTPQCLDIKCEWREVLQHKSTSTDKIQLIAASTSVSVQTLKEELGHDVKQPLLGGLSNLLRVRSKRALLIHCGACACGWRTNFDAQSLAAPSFDVRVKRHALQCKDIYLL